MSRTLVAIVVLFLGATSSAWANCDADSADGASSAGDPIASVNSDFGPCSLREVSWNFCIGKFCEETGVASLAEKLNLTEASDENGDCTPPGVFSCFSPATILQDHGLRLLSRGRLRRPPDTTRRPDENADINRLRPPISLS